MWLILILVLIGVLLLVAELVLLPGISVAGIGSLLAFGAAIFYAFIQYGVLIGLVTLTAAVLLSVLAVFISLRANTWQRLSLKATIDSTSTPTPQQNNILVGQTGTTLTRLAPMGKVRVGEVTAEAKTIDGYINPRQSVEVIGFENTVVIVRAVHHKQQESINQILIIIAFVALILLWFVFYFIPIGLWFSALVSGVRISLLQLVLMRFRKVPPSVIVNQLIAGTKAGLHLQANDLEAHFLAGGNVPNVVTALISAQKANIALDFKMAAAIDLAGRNVAEAVQMSVNPKVINTPPVAAVAKDGIQLIAKARVTVRANIKQLVGGAGEDTVLARVGEGIVSSIGSSASHKTVLENPDFISRVVLEKGLDAGTAFEILSIDIADIDVGKNIGAVLQMDQANADKNIAQAKAGEKRAMAVAMEQEMKAKAQEARAKVILAEAEIPMAIAEAFRSGNLGIMDYYKLQNIQADTRMREGIVKTDKK